MPKQAKDMILKKGVKKRLQLGRVFMTFHNPHVHIEGFLYTYEFDVLTILSKYDYSKIRRGVYKWNFY